MYAHPPKLTNPSFPLTHTQLTLLIKYEYRSLITDTTLNISYVVGFQSSFEDPKYMFRLRTLYLMSKKIVRITFLKF